MSLKGLKIANFLIIVKTRKKQLKPMNLLIKKFPNTCTFCNNDINKFILLLRKGVYPYEYIDSWERFNETTLPNKKAFYSKLYLEDISVENYIHAQKVFEEFKLKNIGEYHDLYVQSGTLLRNKCIEIYELLLLIFYLHLDSHGKLV